MIAAAGADRFATEAAALVKKMTKAELADHIARRERSISR